jgi:hypothetical protein
MKAFHLNEKHEVVGGGKEKLFSSNLWAGVCMESGMFISSYRVKNELAATASATLFSSTILARSLFLQLHCSSGKKFSVHFLRFAFLQHFSPYFASRPLIGLKKFIFKRISMSSAAAAAHNM